VTSVKWQAIYEDDIWFGLLVPYHSPLAAAFFLAGFTADRELESARLSSPCPEGQSNCRYRSYHRLGRGLKGTGGSHVNSHRGGPLSVSDVAEGGVIPAFRLTAQGHERSRMAKAGIQLALSVFPKT